MSNDMRGVLVPGTRRSYITGGNATVTIMSGKTGTRFTYKVTASKPDAGQMPIFFVGLLSGPDNERDYRYIGIVTASGFRWTRKSTVTETAPSFQAFAWLSRHWESDQVEIWHEGRCGRCGRKLTVPDSIASGFGPECIQHVLI